MSEGIRSQQEVRITRLFMSHVTVNAYSGIDEDFEYTDAKVVMRVDRKGRNVLYVGRFTLPGGGMRACSVLFSVIVETEGVAVGGISVLDSETGEISNYLIHQVVMGSETEYIARCVVDAVVGNLDAQ